MGSEMCIRDRQTRVELGETSETIEGTVGHLPSTRREGVASLSLDGLVKNAETLQLLPTHPRLYTLTWPQQLQLGGCPKTPFHPDCFPPPSTLYAPRRTGHKGREDLRLLHLQARG